MRLNRLSIAAIGLSTAAIIGMPASAAAHSNWHDYSDRHDWRQSSSHDWQADKCAHLSGKLANAQANYDPANKQERRHWQKLVNKSVKHDCAVNGTIVDYLAGSSQFSTLVTAVTEAGLVETLQGGEYTVFAPTNAAFAALPAGTLEAVLADKAVLTDILTYHVVAGSVDAGTAKTLTTATMANGKTVSIRTEGKKLFVNDSRVVLYDIQTTNGIIHVIDTVLLPQ